MRNTFFLPFLKNKSFQTNDSEKVDAGPLISPYCIVGQLYNFHQKSNDSISWKMSGDNLIMSNKRNFKLVIRDSHYYLYGTIHTKIYHQFKENSSSESHINQADVEREKN